LRGVDSDNAGNFINHHLVNQGALGNIILSCGHHRRSLPGQLPF
jgi:hypothetical protein